MKCAPQLGGLLLSKARSLAFLPATGLRDRQRALARAKSCEAQALRQRAAQGGTSRKPTIRVRRGGAEAGVGLLTQREVAAILNLSERAGREIQRRAFAKIRSHPAFRTFWREYLTGEVEEGRHEALRRFDLTSAEIAALFLLTQSALERQALRKVLALICKFHVHRL